MSNPVLNHILDHSCAKGAARMVLTVIANYADDSGLAWPEYEKISARAGLSERSTIRAVEELERLGELLVEKHPRTGNRYQIPVPWAAIIIEARPAKPAPSPRKLVDAFDAITDTVGGNEQPITDTVVTINTDTVGSNRGPDWSSITDTGVTRLLTPVSPEPQKNHSNTEIQKDKDKRLSHVHAREGAPAQVAQSPPQTPEEQETMRLKVAAVIGAVADSKNANWSKRT